MQSKASSSRRTLVAIVIVLLLVVIAGYWWRSRPSLTPSENADSISELDANGFAGRVVRYKGDVHFKVGDSATIHKKELSNATGWQKIDGQTNFKLDTTFRLGPGAELQLSPNGGFVVNLDGDGEFYLEKAWADASRKNREIRWVVKQGMIRMKPHEADPAQHMAVIVTPKLEIRTVQASFGVRINDLQGNGQVWVMDGKGTIHHADGKITEIPLKAVQGI